MRNLCAPILGSIETVNGFISKHLREFFRRGSFLERIVSAWYDIYAAFAFGRAFIERLIYQYSSYDADNQSSNAPKKLRTATIYTMNVKQHVFDQLGYDHILGHTEQYLNDIFGYPPVRICAYDIYQYKDYSKYRAAHWNEQEKAEHHRIQFPLDCKAAYEAGRHMVLDNMAEKQ